MNWWEWAIALPVGIIGGVLLGWWSTKPEKTPDWGLYLNPTGATCPCAKSSAVWCNECEGNRRG